MSVEFDKRIDKLIDIVEKLSEDDVRNYFTLFLDALVSDFAGNVHDPFTYLWTREFREIEDAMIGEMLSSSIDTPEES